MSANVPDMNLDSAIALATRAHAGQTDKGGQPYIEHPMRVMLEVSLRAKVAAILHDVVEDTAIGLEDLAAYGVDDVSLDAIDLLTRPGGDDRPTYADYVKRICDADGEAGDVAREVKLADLNDNLRPERQRPDLIGITNRYRRAKWAVLDSIAARRLDVA